MADISDTTIDSIITTLFQTATGKSDMTVEQAAHERIKVVVALQKTSEGGALGITKDPRNQAVKNSERSLSIICRRTVLAGILNFMNAEIIEPDFPANHRAQTAAEIADLINDITMESRMTAENVAEVLQRHLNQPA